MKPPFFKKAVNDYNVYILKLQNGKYYVGITPRINARKNEHKKGILSNPFVQNNLPIDVVYYRNLQTKNVKIAEKIEGYYTVLFIKRYGIKNVLGGHIMGNLEKRKKINERILYGLIKQGKIIDELYLNGKSVSEAFPEFSILYV